MAKHSEDKTMITKIERLADEFGYYLRVTFEDGHSSCWGHGQTDRGSKRMLSVHAKQHGLKKDGDVAVK